MNLLTLMNNPRISICGEDEENCTIQFKYDEWDCNGETMDIKENIGITYNALEELEYGLQRLLKEIKKARDE